MKQYKLTRLACYICYIVQAIVCGLSPLLFVIFQDSFSVSYSGLSILILINFLTQLMIDILSPWFVRHLGYRKCISLACLFSAAGLSLLSVLPYAITPIVGLGVATIIMAMGSGFIEVLISPMIENLPSKNKATEMTLLHSFFCWGHVAVVIVTTLLLHFGGHWRWIPPMWVILPILCFFMFLRAPIIEPPSEQRNGLKHLLKNKTFLLLILLMICSGAAECAMSQWASLFTERTLGVTKVWGDLLGVCGFAAMMGIGRTLYSIFGEKINIKTALAASSTLCIVCYLLASLTAAPLISLLACALCGMSVALMWPGCYSFSCKVMKNTGTLMFALLALGGDIGCSIGPMLTGVMSDFSITHNFALQGLPFGLLVATLFPMILLVCILKIKEKA